MTFLRHLSDSQLWSLHPFQEEPQQLLAVGEKRGTKQFKHFSCSGTSHLRLMFQLTSQYWNLALEVLTPLHWLQEKTPLHAPAYKPNEGKMHSRRILLSKGSINLSWPKEDNPSCLILSLKPQACKAGERSRGWKLPNQISTSFVPLLTYQMECLQSCLWTPANSLLWYPDASTTVC